MSRSSAVRDKLSCPEDWGGYFAQWHKQQWKGLTKLEMDLFGRYLRAVYHYFLREHIVHPAHPFSRSKMQEMGEYGNLPSIR